MKSICSCVICSKSRVRAAAGVMQFHRDILTGDFLSQRFREGDHSRFGGAVGGGVRIAFLACDRRQVNDSSVILLKHVRNNRAATQKDSG